MPRTTTLTASEKAILNKMNVLFSVGAPVSRASVHLLTPRTKPGTVSGRFSDWENAKVIVPTGKMASVDLDLFRKTRGVSRNFSADAAGERKIRSAKTSKTYKRGPKYYQYVALLKKN